LTLQDMVDSWSIGDRRVDPEKTLSQVIDDACAETRNKSGALFGQRIKREIDALTFTDWLDMHNWLTGIAPNGFGPVSVMVVATRLGHALNIVRRHLCLQGKVRLAWNKLHGTRRSPEVRGWVPPELIPAPLSRLDCAEDIEALMLFHIDQLEPWLARKLPDWLAGARATMSPADAARLDRAFVIIGDRPITCEQARLLDVTTDLVDRFAEAMKTKLLVAQLRYGYYDGWASNDWHAACLEQFQNHIAKGDPVDVANYCAFMYHHEWPTNGKWEGDGG
jgi:hypothetical protein